MSRDVRKDPKQKKEFWKRLANVANQGIKIWEEMPFMHDGLVLWHHIKPLDPTILSATGHMKVAPIEKHAWIKKHLGDIPTILVRDAVDKAKYATPNGVLIDDTPKAINAWVAAGGIGVLHINAQDTIHQLRELNL